ncbi:MAG: CHAT domain-containing protein [Nodosilinea sp.]
MDKRLRLSRLWGKGQRRRWGQLVISLLLGIVITVGLPRAGWRPAAATAAAAVPAPSAGGVDWEHRGTVHYREAVYPQAAAAWEQAISRYRAEGDWIGLARTLGNLSLAQQQIGQWSAATAAVDEALSVLQTHDGNHQQARLWAQVLNTQGSLQFGLGQMPGAIAAWEAAAKAYRIANDRAGALESQMNLALALKSAGFYQRAEEQLAAVVEQLRPQPDSPLKAAALQRWADVLRLVGRLDAAEAALTEGLTLTETLHADAERAATLLSWGNTKRIRGDQEAAQDFYQQAIALAQRPSETRILAQLALLDLQVQQQQWPEALTLWPALARDVQQLPNHHQSLYHRINLAMSLIHINQGNRDRPPLAWRSIAEILATTGGQAEELGDRLGQAYALGYLGSIYEQTQQWETAQALTEQALGFAQSMNSGEAAYLWQWQLGRLLQAQHQEKNAILAYGEAIETLKSLRGDLATSQADIQFSFRKNVEPVYREFVSLLLAPEANQAPTPERLAQARQVIESLQLAELDNYFQEACLQGQPVAIDQLEAKSAVLYPIILADRLELILSLPGGEFRHYRRSIAEADLNQLVRQFRQNLVILSRRDFLTPAQDLYNLLVRPMVADLREHDIETLVFVLDGALKSVPMAALHDGDRYLVQEFAIALSPGLQLISPQPLQGEQLSILAAGLTEGRQGFSPLTYVQTEIDLLRTILPTGSFIMDEAFTGKALQERIESAHYPIVHIATHGQFSSERENTFLLAWDDLIRVNELSGLLQDTSMTSGDAIELLVLSACQTAAGDDQAALGLAGFAIKAGARSTLASLWSVNDAATSDLMADFYRELIQPHTTRAEALRQAQLEFLNNPATRHPLYWAPFVMLGSWL